MKIQIEIGEEEQALAMPRATVKKRLPSRMERACPSPCVWLADRITPVGQDRLILTRSGAGAPELQRWARCLLVFVLPQEGINTETDL